MGMFDFRDIGQDVMATSRNPVMPEVDRHTLAPLLGPSPEDSEPSTPELKPTAPGLTRTESYGTGQMGNVKQPSKSLTMDSRKEGEMQPPALGDHMKNTE